MKRNQMLFNQAIVEPPAGGAAAPAPAVTPPAGGAAAPAPAAGGNEIPFSQYVNADLTFAQGYQDHLGEHAKGLNFTNLPDVFKSVKEGTATITRLNQERADLAKKLQEAGVATLPADEAAYKAAIKLPDALPEGVVVPDNLVAQVAKYALENKISPEITNKFIAFQIEQAANEVKTFADMRFAAVEEAKGKISQIVGAQNYDTTIANAKAAHDMLGLNLSAEDLIQNVNLVTSLAKLHQKIEPSTMKAIGLGAAGASAESKLSQAQDILNNPQNPHNAAFYDNSHANHKAAQDQYNRLILESAQ
jgi:hypothetical protein